MIQKSAVDRKSARCERRPLPPSVIARKSNGPESSGANALRQRVGNQGIQRLMSDTLRSHPIQAKLTVSEPGDAHEREADRVADAVMRMPANDVAIVASNASPAKVQRMCTDCEEEQKHQAILQVQRKEQAADSPSLASPVATNIQALRGGGSALPAATRAFFEPRFGTDFSGVRVHTDERANATAKSIGAKAFTLGQDIVFASGLYSPASREGRYLLAHELTHVTQQRNGLNGQVQRQPIACANLMPTHPIARVGTIVHDMIEANFVSTIPDARRGLPIPGAYANPLRTQGLCGRDKSVIDPQVIGPSPRKGGRPGGVGYPDLARITAGGILQVAELKPAAIECLVDGEEQALRYINEGNAQDPDQKAWRASLGIRVVAPMLPSTYQPPPLPLGPCRVRTAWCTPGLMAYSVVCPGPPPVPVPRDLRQEQEQRQRARDDDPLFRLPRGPIWDKVYGAIAILGALAILGTLWGKIGALLGTLARILGFTLGLAGVAAADTAQGGSTRSVPGGVRETPGRTGRITKGLKASDEKVPVPKPETGRTRIKLIEGLNLEKVEPGMAFPVMLHQEGRPSGEGTFGTVILQVAKKTSAGNRTIVEFRSLQEAWTDQKAGKVTRTMGGKTYVVEHPYRDPDSPTPGLIGSVHKTGPDPRWFWTYLENLADKLQEAGRKADADRVRKEVRRLKQQAN